MEKRKVLTTLSHEMRVVFDTEVPKDTPGLICYDTYRAQLDEDPSNRAIPEVREVLDKTRVLRARVARALPTPEYESTALRIVDALAVHRLTTADVNAPIGPSVVELRDDLALLPPGLPELDSLFLETTVGSVIDDIIRAVSGQFITLNEENGQVYLDILKDIDYDQRIEERAKSLDYARLDRAYFRALETVLEQRDTPYVAGYRIWAYELDWPDKRVTRSGYLFMGAPNERSTAQPPRDFYVYFLQPYDQPGFTDEEKPDEVFVKLNSPGDEFTDALRRYAGAEALETESTGQHRTVYAGKREKHLQTMVGWLRAHMGTAVTVTYRGETLPLASWLPLSLGPRKSVKEQIDTIAGAALVGYFEERYPGYPSFGAHVTQENLQKTVSDALRQVITGRPNALGGKILASLGLIDVQGTLVESGLYAQQILNLVGRGGGQAVNRAEFFTERDPGVTTWKPWHLEPCWFVVVAAVLTQLGRLEIGFRRGPLDALALDSLLRMDMEEMESVTHIVPPRELPIQILRDAVLLMDIPPGHVRPDGADEHLVQSVGVRCIDYADRIATARGALNDGIRIWGADVLEQRSERSAALRNFEVVVRDLRARNTVGKLNKLDLSRQQIAIATDGKRTLEWIEEAAAVASHVADITAYLREAIDVFGSDHTLSVDAVGLRTDLLDLFRSDSQPDAGQAAMLKAIGEQLRHRFTTEAVAAHGRDRLDGAGDERKRQLLEGRTYTNLKRLTLIELLPGGRFASLEQALTNLRTCKTFDPGELSRSVTCPECTYRPRPADHVTAAARLNMIEEQIRRLFTEWERALADSLATSEMIEQIALLKPDERTRIEAFVDTRRLPEIVTEEFVRAVQQVLNRFEVRAIESRDVWNTLFPEAAPATPAELKQRFDALIDRLVGDASEARVRLVPTEGQGL